MGKNDSIIPAFRPSLVANQPPHTLGQPPRQPSAAMLDQPPRQPLAATPPLEGNRLTHYGSTTSVADDSRRDSPPEEGWQPKADGVVERHTNNFMSLPYNPDLKNLARKLRRAGNLAEVLLWEQIKNRKFKNYDFDRQKIIGNYIVDFFCVNCNVVIEIDGGSHEYKQERDIERDAVLTGLGLEVIRIPDRDVRKNMSGVLDMLFEHPSLAVPLRRATNARRLGQPARQPLAALRGQPPRQPSAAVLGQPPRQPSAATPPLEGNRLTRYGSTASVADDSRRDSPPEEGNPPATMRNNNY